MYAISNTINKTIMNIFSKLTQQVRHSYLQMPHCYFLSLLMKTNLNCATQICMGI